jgi:hypothetical protein
MSNKDWFYAARSEARLRYPELHPFDLDYLAVHGYLSRGGVEYTLPTPYGPVAPPSIPDHAHRQPLLPNPPKQNQTKSSIEDVGDIEVNEVDIQIQAYCVMCREKREIQRPARIRMKKDGRPAFAAHCPVCGTLVFRLISSPPP